jgi:hypothetical protein
MHSRITKLAAAAVTIIAGFVVIYQSGDSIDIATVSFAQISENMKQMPWLHTVVEGAGDRLEAWFCFERRIMMQKHLNGEIRCQDDLKQIIQVYNPDANTVTVSYAAPYSLAGMGRSALDFPKLAIKFFEEGGGKMIQEKGKYKGIDATIYKMSGFLGGMDMKIEMTVDAEKNIPLFLNQKAFDKNGKLTIEANAYFDYPEMGPKVSMILVFPGRQKSRRKEGKTTYEKAYEKQLPR